MPVRNRPKRIYLCVGEQIETRDLEFDDLKRPVWSQYRNHKKDIEFIESTEVKRLVSWLQNYNPKSLPKEIKREIRLRLQKIETLC